MRLTSCAALLSCAALKCVASNYCLAPDPPDSLVAAHKLLAEQESHAGSRLMRRDLTRLDIDFYVHIVESRKKTGEIKDDIVQQQVWKILDDLQATRNGSRSTDSCYRFRSLKISSVNTTSSSI